MNVSIPAPRASELYTEQFWIASASHFLLGMGFWMFVLFPLHLAALGAGEAWIGVLLALEPTAAVAVRPALGGILTKRGRRAVLRAGGVLNLLSVALYLVTDDIGLGMSTVRILHGIGIGALFTTFFTFAADICPVERRTEGLAVFGVSGLLPTAFAPALGEEIVARFGFQGLFVAAIGFSIASLYFTWKLEEPELGESGDPQGFWRMALDRRLTSVWVTALCFSFGMASYLAFLAPWAHQRGLSRVGLFFFCYSLAAVVLRVVGRRLPDRVGPRRVLLPALSVLAFGLFLVSRLDSQIALGIAGLCCGLGHGYLFPILSGLAVEGVDRNSRGSAMSFYTAVFDLGQMIGPPLFGVIAEAAGYSAMFLTAMLGVMAALLLWIPETFRGLAYARAD